MGSKKCFQRNARPMRSNVFNGDTTSKQKQISGVKTYFPLMRNMISFIRTVRWICET